MFIELGKKLREQADKDNGIKNKINSFIRLYSTKLDQKEEIDKLKELLLLADIIGDALHALNLVSVSEDDEKMKTATLIYLKTAVWS